MYKFRNDLGQIIFDRKYRNDIDGCSSWPELSEVLVRRITGKYLTEPEQLELIQMITDMKFIPAGRYLYYAGRPMKFINNCIALKAEDSREGWADLGRKHFMSLMCGCGVGTHYGLIRGNGSPISKTGGQASGPLSLMNAMNEIGRNVMQGGSRRSALWAGLPWDHPDIDAFMTCKDYTDLQKKCKEDDFNFPLPMDMTNISVCYDANWLQKMRSGDDEAERVFKQNILQACKSGEPGFSFNINHDDILANACTEFKTDQDSDVCNLGSVNMSRINDLNEFRRVCYMGAKFLYCGSLEADLPYEDCVTVRKDHRKIGLGLTGVHEWLLAGGYGYEFSHELHVWMSAYEDESQFGADHLADQLGTTQCQKYRCIAPAGTISILAGTTSGIEPLFAVATKRRFLDAEQNWQTEYYVDPTAIELQKLGINLDNIETAYKLSSNPQKRIRFQSDMQEYVDMAISSTIQLPNWDLNPRNYALAGELYSLLSNYAPRLRGITFFPDGSRGGQPLTEVSMREVDNFHNTSIEAAEASANAGCKGGVCGI